MPTIKALGKLRQKDQELKGPNNKAILSPPPKIARLSQTMKQKENKTQKIEYKLPLLGAGDFILAERDNGLDNKEDKRRRN